jgi:hypothetical protein
MRLDARKGDKCWLVFDCRRVRRIRHCVWVDDAVSQYGAWENQSDHALGEAFFMDPPVTQCDRISIITTSRLILIDPVADDESDLIEVAVSRPTPLGVN